MIRLIFVLFLLSSSSIVHAQVFRLTGKVVGDHHLSGATVAIPAIKKVTKTNDTGSFVFDNLPAGDYQLRIHLLGYRTKIFKIAVLNDTTIADISLTSLDERLDELVVTGTQKEVNRLQSSVPVEIYSAKFFQKNPTPSIFDALQNVNGIRPQLNCNICNTGDIHINGLEGPYTMVMIDGMPIVSSLSTVYGLSGIPNAMVDRLEIVKGPASSLYGSEAVGGLINIITKEVGKASLLTADVMSTSYLENQVDLSFKNLLGKTVSVLTGMNYFNYSHPVDHNNDQFTDVTLQDRISVFQKWNFKRKENRTLSLAGRFLHEDRWGGDMRWNKSHRGGDDIYGESIYTKRFEILGKYQLPIKEKMFMSFSGTHHEQDSRYGETSYIATQRILFSQLTWDKKIGKHDLLAGAALRHTYYDDNTPATVEKAENTLLPGIFVQDEYQFNQKHSLLAGLRYDHHTVHGAVLIPRLAYKMNLDENSIIRLNAGTGFRVVNLFTEDHAALTGARTVEIASELNPEKSYNVNLNFLKRFYTEEGSVFTVDLTGFYTHFTNRIVADYTYHADKIRYGNLDGFAVSRGVSGNMDMSLRMGLKANLGFTLQDVSTTKLGQKKNQILTEKWMGTWSVSYHFNSLDLGIDYTGNIYGPMQLPLLGASDPRLPFSPVWSLQNIQFSYHGFKNVEFYGGVKNILNFKPTRNNPFLIARTQDPFDKKVQFDGGGNAIATPDNPYGLTFDPTYMYAPNQGIRAFFGIRVNLR